MNDTTNTEPKPYQNEFYYLLKNGADIVAIHGQNGGINYLSEFNGRGMFQGSEQYLTDQFEELVKYGLIETVERMFHEEPIVLRSSKIEGLTDSEREAIDDLYYRAWVQQDQAYERFEKSIAEQREVWHGEFAAVDTWLQDEIKLIAGVRDPAE